MNTSGIDDIATYLQSMGFNVLRMDYVNDAEATAQSGAAPNTGCEHLLSMPVRQLMHDPITLRKLAINKQQELTALKGKTSRDLWIADLDELETGYVSTLPPQPSSSRPPALSSASSSFSSPLSLPISEATQHSCVPYRGKATKAKKAVLDRGGNRFTLSRISKVLTRLCRARVGELRIQLAHTQTLIYCGFDHFCSCSCRL